MSDNVTISQGSGTIIGTDDIGGVQIQRVKATFGVDGTATDVSASNPLPVNFTNTTLAVTGAFYQATQPISAAALPLPAGAATAAKQPALGIAGTPSSDVITVQGATSMTALKVDGSAVTQPVSGTITANAGTGTFAVSAASLPLPTGAATSANQTTLNTNIGSSADAVLTTGNSGSNASYLRTIMEQSLSTAPAAVKIDQTTDGTTNRVNAVPGSTAYALIPAPSAYRVPSAAATTNAANIKASAGCVKGVQGYNNKASAVYIRFYDLATSPTVGTSTLRKTLQVPASSAFAYDFGTGIGFATGISIAMTGAGGDADTTALASGDITTLNVDYH